MTQIVLVSGGLGYVGGRVVQHLAGRGFVPRIMTRRPAERWPAWAREYDIRRADLGDMASLEGLCQDVQAIVHLAAMNEIESARNPIEALRTTGVGTASLLEAAHRKAVCRFIHFSTIHVYGADLTGRISEESLPRPRHPYARSHRAAEDCVLAARDPQGLLGIALRMSNVVGAPADPWIDRWTLLANDLSRQAVTQGKLVLKSSGLDRRDFISLSDVLGALEKVLLLPAEIIGDGLFNLTSGQSRTILSVAERIAARAEVVLGERLPIERGAGSSQLPRDFYFANDKIRGIGVSLSGEIDGDLDAALRFCHSTFGRQKTT